MRIATLVPIVSLLLVRAVEGQTAWGNVHTGVQNPSIGQASDMQGGSGTFTASASAAISVASGSGTVSSSGSTLAAHCAAHIVGGSQAPAGYSPRSDVTFVLARQVCLIPTDSMLLGQPVNVTFGTASASPNVAVAVSSDLNAPCCFAIAVVQCAYSINGLGAGGYTRYLSRSPAICPAYATLVDTFQPLASSGVTVTFGTPFTVRLDGSVTAVGQAFSSSAGGVVYQPNIEATATADFSLGFPDLLISGGTLITQYTWMDCGSGLGVPVVPISTLPPDPGFPSCFGDGATGSTACPCANHSALGLGAGCMNAAGTAGKLRAQGTPSLTADDVVLLATGMPSTVCLFFQGTEGIPGVAFGDGLLCVGGTVLRLKVQAAGSGDASMPSLGDSALSIQGALPPSTPTARSYQVWYRDADPTFCTSATFNLSNALRIEWTP